jgi:CBS domain-containing protein
MTTPVVSVQESTTLKQAVDLMLQRGFSGLPVTDAKGRLVGMVTEGDLLRRAELGTQPKHGRWLQFFLSAGQLADEYTRAHGRLVGEIMTPGLYTLGPDDSLEALVTLMNKHGIKRVPIVQNGSLMGIVSRADVLRALDARLPNPSNVTRDDARISSEIDKALAAEPGVSSTLVQARVLDGNVHLTGAIFDERLRAAIRVAVENVPGVRSIHDHMVWIEPTSGAYLLSQEDEAREGAPTVGAGLL